MSSSVQNDVEIHGSVTFKGELNVCGQLTGGSIKGPNLTVGSGASVTGNVEGESLTLHGILKGDVRMTGKCDIKGSAQLLGNLTNAGTTRQAPSMAFEPGFLTVFPADAAAVPNISNLNTYESVAVPNMALIKYSASNQTVSVFNAAGYSHYILDVSAVVLA